MPGYKRVINLIISAVFWGLVCLRDSLVRLVGIRLRKPWVILYYHVVARDQRARFASQMDVLLRWAQTIAGDATPVDRGIRYVSVTFDDVSETFYNNALPELQRRQIPCTLFATSGLLGKVVNWDNYSDQIISADTLRSLNTGLVTIGSHTVSHPMLTSLSPSSAAKELHDSKAELEAMLQSKVTLFSFPFGAFSEQLVAMCRSAGYQRAFTTMPSGNFDSGEQFVYGRVRVDPSDWPAEFYLKILGSYRWLPTAFLAKKKIISFFTAISAPLRGFTRRSTLCSSPASLPPHSAAKHLNNMNRKDTLIKAPSARPYRYVLVTAAYNEEQYIEHTIRSVLSQTLLPHKWLIVSDGSTDKTDQIVQGFAKEYSFIELHRITEEHSRNFAAQVDAINAGVSRLATTDFEYIANLDADISFGREYYATLLQRLASDPALGLVGGSIFEDHGHGFQRRLSNSVNSVAHAVQLFRRECFEAIGGYVPLKYGGPDWVAEVKVRQLGWRVHSFPDLVVLHHRPAASAGGFVRGWYRQGLMDYSLGSLPFFEFIKCVRRLREHPPIIGAAARWTAFCISGLRHAPRLVSSDFIDYLRQEQRQRLRAMIGFASASKQNAHAAVINTPHS